LFYVPFNWEVILEFAIVIAQKRTNKKKAIHAESLEMPSDELHCQSHSAAKVAATYHEILRGRLESRSHKLDLRDLYEALEQKHLWYAK
jgi:hypothetical protein